MKRKLFIFLILILLLTPIYYAFSDEATQTSEQSSGSSGPSFGFGFSFGTVVINGVTYFQINGKPDFSIGLFGIGLDINLEFDGNWKLRETEWNSWQAILSKIRYVRWAYKGSKPLYVKVGQIEDATIGNGFIMWNYANNLNYPNMKKLGIAFDLDLGYGGFESFVDNIFDVDIIGLRGFARPLYGTDIFLLKELEIGASIVGDTDPFNPIPTNSPYNFSDSELSKGREIYIAGGDLGLPIVNIPSIFDLKWFVDFAYIFNKGTGESTGFKGTIISLIPYRFEIRYLQPKFIPSFFDTLYESERYVMLSSSNLLSKYDLLDNITNSYAGFLFTTGVSFDTNISLLVTIDDSFDDTSYPHMILRFHLNRSLTRIINFDFVYERKNIKEWRDIYTTESTDAVINAKLSYKVSDMVNIVVFYTRSFDWFEENGQMVLKPLESTAISTEIQF
jgi:hypothetical protein